MSKWSDDFAQQYKDLKSVRKATKDVIKKGGKLALEEYHDAKSLKQLKKYIKEKC
jgi:hypothetical protein